MTTKSKAPWWRRRSVLVAIGVLTAFGLILQACTSGSGSGSASFDDVNSRRAEAGLQPLSADQFMSAGLTYLPSGEHDPYIMFSSAGHAGQMYVIGVPSMRLLKSIGVFTPEPWQGWGYGNVGTMEVLEAGNVDGKEVRWADTHHPALSETAGDYDGEWVFINDKANARIAVIDLRDFETKQIVKNPIAINDHGGTMVTPDTEWIIEGGQYATPHGWEYAPIESYESDYKGMVTLWKFDREVGRVDESQSFALELPPYWQDLCDAGKLASDGWIFCNSFNTEMATGAGEDGSGENFEAGASARDNDYLHVINLNRAVELAAAGQTFDVNGFPVIGLQTLIDEGVLYFVPEPKSPHGVDIAPMGDYIVISGKLDPHVTIYSFEKVQQAIADQNWVPDPFGVPVLDFDAVTEAQVELGLGPLHTQFGTDGYAYTSLFLDSSVARWSLGGENYRGDEGWKLEGTVPVHYNIGHLAAPEGDTVSPDGQYVVALNKWSIDRFFPPGPLLPQNFQLIDTSMAPDAKPDTGGMTVMYDMPIGIGEPHYAQIIKADKLSPLTVYPEIGWDPAIMAVDPNAPQVGTERIERNGNQVEIWMTAVRSHYTPDRVEINEGDEVTWHVTNIDTSVDATHGFSLPAYNINLSLEPGETATMQFTADRSGVYPFYCSEFCSALHLEMAG
ncbi:MAG TPA: Sec-dependent nitrous-oxide reductase, partial [Acidimicrobiia bacterium]|nr:Sec-dependent nitrous-oxide reductase [Acidimicrobiia bacterium]